ncbi:Nop protein [Rhizoctonia solani]|uniref:Nucleolar protein 58 n=1 Tax=Rhizoctonia solani TaxID=456999 RepID=A0A8H7IK86_9AGAM|nr:Nop protein [Rhizoctonia solani]
MLVLYETSLGFCLFKLNDEAKLTAVTSGKTSRHPRPLPNSSARLKLKAIHRFTSTAMAVEDISAMQEGKLSKGLKQFLQDQVVDKGKGKESLAVIEPKLGGAIAKKLGIQVVSGESTQDLFRGIRSQLSSLLDGLDPTDLSTMSLGLSHSLSRFKLKFSPDKVDIMVIQAIALLDDLDKEINIYSMRVKEWYGWHFPEMGKLIVDNLAYAKVVREMGFRTNAATTSLASILPEELELTLKAAAEISMGTEISDSDISHIHSLCDQVISISAYRAQLSEYLRNRMNAIAPNLTALVGELVGARLISHAGSLMSLAKHPASTVQILGAEKALFRALKTKHDTPKYGLIYHCDYDVQASLIGQAPQKLKGKMARMVATKAALSIRVDALADVDEKSEATAATIGIENRAKLESRLRALEHQSDLGSLPFANTVRKQSKFEMSGSTKQYNTAADSVGADQMDLDPIPTERAPTDAAADAKEERRKAKEEKKKAKAEKKAKKEAKKAEEEAAVTNEDDEEAARKEKKRLKKEAKKAAAAAVAEVAAEMAEEAAPVVSNGSEKKQKKRRVDEGESPEKKVSLGSLRPIFYSPTIPPVIEMDIKNSVPASPVSPLNNTKIEPVGVAHLKGQVRSASNEMDSQRPPKRSRKAINCDPCRASKLKCDRGRPCSGCVLRGTTALCYPDSGPAEHGQPAQMNGNEAVHDNHAGTGDPYAEIARMRQSLATLESLLTRHGISPQGSSRSGLNRAHHNHTGADANGHNTPSQVGSTPSPDGLMTESTVYPAMEVGMYVGPTSAASPLLSFRVRSSCTPRNQAQPLTCYIQHMLQPNGVFEGGTVPTETSPDESGAASCSLDVQQNLDLLAKLPDVSIVDGLLRHYFENCTWLNKYLNEPSLQTSWTRFKASTCTDQLTVSILFAVLAISLLYLPKAHPLVTQLGDNVNLLSEEYYQNSTIALDRHRATGPKVPTMELVELHLLRAGYLSISKVDCEEIWTIKGEVMSIALSLGLHRDPGKWKLSKEQIERRRWAWWNVLQLDRWQAFLFGRPISIPNSHFDTNFPVENKTDPSIGAVNNPNLPYLHQFKLTLVLGDIVADATSCRPTPYDRILAHERELESWFQNLPHDLAVDDYHLASLLSSQALASRRLGVQSLCIRALAYHIKFTLHRPFTTPQIRRDSRTSASYDASIIAADKLIHLWTTSRPDFMSNPLLAVPGHISWGPFHIFAAAIHFCFLLIWKPDQPGTAMFRSNIQRVITTLESLRVEIPVADKALRVLQTLAPLYMDGTMRKVDEKQRDSCLAIVRRLAFPCHDSRLSSRPGAADSPSQTWASAHSPASAAGSSAGRSLDSVQMSLQPFGAHQFEPSPYPQNSSEEAVWSASLGLDGDSWNMFLMDGTPSSFLNRA